MAEYSTRISDLPENITTQIQSGGGISQVGGQNTYTPINIHPNPYGIPPQPPNGMPLPEPSPQRSVEQTPNQNYENRHIQQPHPSYDPMVQEASNQQQQYRLPSRDIPMSTLELQQDVEVQPNYIPKAKVTSDYIREYEAAGEDAMKKHKQEKYRERVAGDVWSQLQIPILVALLYFIFQMPIMNTLFRRHFSFLSIYNSDGNFNFMGLVMKSLVFGCVFYGAQYISEFFA